MCLPQRFIPSDYNPLSSVSSSLNRTHCFRLPLLENKAKHMVSIEKMYSRGNAALIKLTTCATSSLHG